MRAEDLVIGKLYFEIVYPDRSLLKPIIITFEYVRDGSAEEEPGYVFKLLPAFWEGERPEPEEELLFYRSTQIEGLFDLKGLIEKLTEIQQRIG